MPTRNKWQSALQPGHSCSKKGHSERVETKRTTSFGWWWSLEKSSPLQSLQPKNPSDLQNLQSPFTCKMLLNLPHVLIFHLDLLLSNVKNTCFAFIFLFCDEKTDYDYYMLLHKKIVKILLCVFIFPFVMENSLFLITYSSKFHPTFFFLVRAFMPKGWISTPSKFWGSR